MLALMPLFLLAFPMKRFRMIIIVHSITLLEQFKIKINIYQIITPCL